MTVDKVYISGPLMAAKNLESVKELYDYIAQICCENGLVPYLPHNNTDPIKDSDISDDEVYKKDYLEMINSSLVISYIGEPSHGVGAELSICISQNIPVITINEVNQKVSRFLKGMLKTSNRVCSVEYENTNELRKKLSDCLHSISSECS
ncbi:MAG TPA: nucleoside 2-deoxyribosyltransferase [Chitinophagaceae bacterium]|nr:nucleoside 2-deoxyribosyltransferase [Chitinophagaceae bacterium]